MYIDVGYGSWLYIHKRFFDLEESNNLIKDLKSEKPNTRHVIKMHGKDVSIPRFQKSYGKSYRYSGSETKSVDFIPALSLVKEKTINHLKNNLKDVEEPKYLYTMALVNWYEDGSQYISPHSDSTTQLYSQSTIASISLGATRDFVIKPKKGYTEHGLDMKISLENGDLVVMGGDFQKTHTHAVPKRLRCKDERVNITFRVLID